MSRSQTNSGPLGFIPASFRQPAFLVAAGVLLSAAVGLNAAVAYYQLYFQKVAVPPARELTQINSELGDWIQVSRDEPLDHDVQEVLGTDRYIFRDYLKVPAHGGECAAELIVALHKGEDGQKLADLRGEYLASSTNDRQAMLQRELADKDITLKQRKEALGQVQYRFPDSVINMAVTYYTGMVDTVAHIPDRCYVADGFEPTEYEEPVWQIPGHDDLQVRFINFSDSSGASRINRSVAYFFHVNGHYESNPLGVRNSLANLFEKYGYYAKVELMMQAPQESDLAVSARTMKDFLSSALPEVEKSFPNWKKVTSGK